MNTAMKYQTSNLVRQAEQALRLADKMMINHVSRHDVDRLLKLMAKLEAHKGQAQAIKLLKSYQHYVSHVTIGISPSPLPWCSVGKSGFPKVLRP